MKRIDFEKGTVTGNILNAAIPMLVAQILNLLYNIVDRIYIARIHDIGTTALGAVGLCFPIIMIITAFSNLFGSGGAPIFSINRGKGDSRTADMIMNTAFTMLCGSAAVLMLIGFLFARPLLTLFGALTVIRRRMREKGQFILSVEPPTGDNQLRIGTVKTGDGKVWWAAFTGFEEELKGGGGIQSTFLTDIDQLFNSALQVNEIEGIILNPWNRTIMLDKNLINIILGNV